MSFLEFVGIGCLIVIMISVTMVVMVACFSFANWFLKISKDGC
jgi:hypothetical protein